MSYVIDSSALLAVLRKERGYQAVLPILNGSQMSTVNLAEVVQKTQQLGTSHTSPNRFAPKDNLRRFKGKML